MYPRSRLRRGISLEVIFEEDHMRPASHAAGSEVTDRSRSPNQLQRRAPSLMTLNEHGNSYPNCWEEDEFSEGASTISRRQILGLPHLYTTPPTPGAAPSAVDADATRRWVDAHSPRRRPLTVGELRGRHRDGDSQRHRQHHQQPLQKQKQRGTDFLGRYQLADLLVNDNIVIVDTTPSSATSSSPEPDDGLSAEPAESVGEGELPPPQTVRRVADRFERLARAEPDSYVLWRDTARLCGCRANPSSKILRSDGAASQHDCHRLFQQELHQLFRARRAGQTTVRSADADADTVSSSSVEVDATRANEPDEADSLFSSDEGDASSGGSVGGDGVSAVSADALERIRRQGVTVTYHGPRRPLARPSLGQLVAAARRQPAYVAVTTTVPRVVDVLPKLRQRQSQTLPTRRSSPLLLAAAADCGSQAAGMKEVTAATLGRRPLAAEAGGWRETGRCYVYDFSRARARRPPPIQIKAPPI